jgi:hypothetical protein
MTTISKMIQGCVFALCVMAPAIGHAEDVNSLRSGCKMYPANATALDTGTYTNGPAQSTILRLKNRQSEFRNRFWLRKYGTHSSGLGAIVKLVHMSSGFCYVRKDDTAGSTIRLGYCGDAKAEWVSDSLGGGQYRLLSSTNTGMAIGTDGTADGAYLKLETSAGTDDQKWDFFTCRNLNNESASPG